MTSVTLVHTRHVEAYRAAASRRHPHTGGALATPVESEGPATRALRTAVRFAAGLPKRLAFALRAAPAHRALGEGLLEPCADARKALGRLS